jgi:hypothetical protein
MELRVAQMQKTVAGSKNGKKYYQGFSKQDIINLFRFTDWLMFLPETEDALFWEEVSVFEKEECRIFLSRRDI